MTLTCIVSKIMESFVPDALVAHLQDNGLLSKEHHGFAQGRSCTIQLLSALEMWTSTLDDGNRLDAVFLDFKKAFDTVPHQKMVRKLHGYGIDSYLHTWIESFLFGRKQCAMSWSWKEVGSGIPHGSVLGPILFVAYINDLPESVSSDVRLFADDTKIYRRIYTLDDYEDLQNRLG